MRYAEIEDVTAAFRELTGEERDRCLALLEEAGLIVDAYNAAASEEAKKLVSCRMVRRQLGDSEPDGIRFPMGSTQGTATALGYSQSWTMSGGSSGELYLSRLEKKLLGAGNKIGSYSPVEALCDAEGN